MASYLCHEEPNLLEHEARVVATRPGAILLDRSALHPGGGGQECDHATLHLEGRELSVRAVHAEGSHHWLEVGEGHALETGQSLQLRVDAARRSVLAQLHTATHILNALVYQRFEGALVTGAQINGDGTARMDFDLPDAQNDLLRALEEPVNAAIRAAHEVRTSLWTRQEAAAEPGLIRSLSVAPPPSADGRIRVVEILGLDRQACGGTHLSNTAQSLPIRIGKIENKGRQNRRVRLALVQPA